MLRINKLNSLLHSLGFMLILVLSLFYACGEKEELSPTFDLIQSNILDTSCAISGCHQSTADATFIEHGLVLEKSVAFENLVDAEPTNANAKADGLLRVFPNNPAKSLLFHKIYSNINHHHHNSDYGNPMPLGLELLSEGQVEFIKRWIAAGAPRDKGVVADLSLLEDNTPQPENFIPLEVPVSGYQINIEKFEVAPEFEREFFVYKKLGNTQDIFVNRVEIKMRRNSHHFLLYDFNDPNMIPPELNKVRDIRNPDGSMNYLNMLPMLFHVYVAGAQTPYLDYEFPEGVALHLPANAALDFNSHYVNKQKVPIDGEVNVNLHTIPAASVQKIAKTINWGNNSFSLPPNQETVISRTYTVDKRTHVFSLTSHTHSLGKKFVIKISGGARNGEIVYTSTDWHHPLIINYNMPIVLEVGEGLTSEITYNNNTSSTVSFGLTSEDEMGIIFGYCYEED